MKRSALIVLAIFLTTSFMSLAQTTYYISTDGDDENDGSVEYPWATVYHALDNVSDSDTILIKAGTYYSRIRLRGSFPSGVVVRSEVPYMAKFRYNDGPVVVGYENASGCNGITLDGLDIAHEEDGAAPLVLHIDGAGTGAVHDITIQNCILHDSFNNDIAKINHSCYNITVQGNLFFNQTGSDEHIDGNSVENLIIQDNIFMNDFENSGRINDNSTSSFIVIKDSNGDSDMYLGSKDVTIRRNVFLNWTGSLGAGFILLGEDGQPFYEAVDILIENNLILGNSENNIRSPFGIKGGKDITFRNNTIAGDLPGNAFAFRFNLEGDNPVNDSIFIYNNIWSDPTGSMGDFSDCPLAHTSYFELDNNLYWNNETAIPESGDDYINFTDDENELIEDPLLGSQDGIIAPHFNSETNEFLDGSASIREAFERLVNLYGTPESDSPVINAANAGNAPSEDILGNLRDNPDLGALEYGGVTAQINETTLTNNLAVFPNPTTGLFTLTYQSDFIGTIHIALYSTEGKIIDIQTIEKAQEKVTITYSNLALEKGIYLIQLQSGTSSQTEKVIVY